MRKIASILFYFLITQTLYCNAINFSKDSIVDILLKENRFIEANLYLTNLINSSENSSEADYAKLYNCMSIVKIKLSQPDSSLLYINKALNKIKKISNKKLIIDIWVNAGNSYKFVEKKDSAVICILNAIQLSKEINHPIALCKSYNSLGIIYNSLDRPNDALEIFLLSKDIAFNLDEPNTKAQTLYNLGLTYFRLDQTEFALNILEEAKIKATQIKDFNLLFYVYNCIADIHQKNNNREKWKSNFKKANSLAKSFGNKEATLIGLCSLAEDAVKHEEYEIAFEYVQRAFKGLKDDSFPAVKQRLNKLLYNAYKASGNYEKALEYFEDYSHRKDSLNPADSYDVLSKTLLTCKNSQNHLSASSTKRITITSLLIIFVLLIIIFFIVKRNIHLKRQYSLTIKENHCIDEKLIQTTTKTEDDKEEQKYKTIYDSLIQLLDIEKIYLNPDLQQEDIIKKLYTNKKYLYYSIKKYSKSNFKGLINSYRIDEAKTLIISMLNQSEEFILSDIYSICGFSTNESFYRIFKAITNQTPGEFAKKQVNNSK